MNMASKRGSLQVGNIQATEPSLLLSVSSSDAILLVHCWACR